jgi:hypothetical protein
MRETSSVTALMPKIITARRSSLLSGTALARRPRSVSNLNPDEQRFLNEYIELCKRHKMYISIGNVTVQPLHTDEDMEALESCVLLLTGEI